LKVLYITLVVFLADQISKLVVKGISIPQLNIDIPGMFYGQSINVIESFFWITFVENPGMAFGIDVGDGQKLFLSLFSLLASVAIIYYLYKVRNGSLVLKVGLALILGGALGNLVDRTFYGLFYDYAPIFYGRVVDFFQVEFWDFTLFGHTYEKWPIFNVADAAVTSGVLLIIIFHREFDKEEELKKVGESAPSNDLDSEEELIENLVHTDTLENNSNEIESSEEISGLENGKDNNKEEIQV